MSEALPSEYPNTPRPARAAVSLAPWFAEARALIALGAPLALTQLAQMAMPTTDLLMIGTLGEEPLAVIALANTVYVFIWLLGLGPAAAMSPVIAHIVGAHPSDRARTRNSLRMGLWAVFLLTPLLGAVLVFSEAILLALGQSPALAAQAAPYTQLLALSLPFSLGFNVLRNFATALGHARAPLFIVGAAAFLNAFLAYTFIFGHFGVPRLELVGAALATTLSQIFMFGVMAAIATFGRDFRSFRIWRRLFRPDWPRLNEILRLGLSMGLTLILEVALFLSATLVIGFFGASAVAAHQIAMNVPSLTFMVPLGLAMAATVRVGRAAGAGDSEGVRRAGFTAIFVAMAFMLVSSLLIASFPRAITGLYIDVDDPANARATELAVQFLYVAAAFQVFDGIQVMAAFALRGLKDTHIPMWLAGISYWLVGFPLAVAFAFVWGLEGFGVWLGLATSLAAAALLMTIRFIYLSAPGRPLSE